jgi:hypothetical protein
VTVENKISENVSFVIFRINNGFFCIILKRERSKKNEMHELILLSLEVIHLFENYV